MFQVLKYKNLILKNYPLHDNPKYEIIIAKKIKNPASPALAILDVSYRESMPLPRIQAPGSSWSFNLPGPSSWPTPCTCDIQHLLTFHRQPSEPLPHTQSAYCIHCDPKQIIRDHLVSTCFPTCGLFCFLDLTLKFFFPVNIASDQMLRLNAFSGFVAAGFLDKVVF